MDNGSVTIEFIERNDKKIFLCIFRDMARRPKFTGQLFHSISKSRRIEEKANKHQLKMATVMATPDKKNVTCHSVISFSRHEDLTLFEEEFAKAVEILKS